MKKRAFIILLTLALLFALTPVAQARTFLSIATGGSGAVYYPLGSDIAKLLNSSIADTETLAQVSGGSEQNLKLLDAGMVELGIVQNDMTAFAYMGNEAFEGDGMDSIAVIGALYTETMHLIGSEALGMTSIEDLRGKRVSLGVEGTSVYYNALHLLEAAGIGLDEIEVFNLGYGDAGKALGRKSLDAFFCTASVPSPAVVSMIEKNGACLIPFSQELIGALIDDKPYYAPRTLPVGTYLGQTEDLHTFTVSALLVCSCELSDSLVYSITKSLYEGASTMSHAKKSEIKLPTALLGVGPLPVHAGAAQFYSESGLTVSNIR